MIRFVCECGRQLQAREDDIGKKAKCPSCNRVLTVPREGDARPRKRRRRDDRDDYDDWDRRRGDEYDEYDDKYDDVVFGPATATSGKATASLVVGLISLCLPVFLPGLIGLTLGIVALRNISASGGRLGGRGLAIGGIVTSSVSFLLFAPCLILVGMLFPSLTKVSETAARVQDQENLKQIGLAFQNFHDANTRLPQAVAYHTKNNQPGLSWRVALLPYMGQDVLFRRFKLDEPWDSPNNQPLLAEMPRVYLMPNQPNDRSGLTHYQVFTGPRTLFEAPNPQPGPGPEGVRLGLRFLDVTDGVSNTVLATTSRSPVPWTRPDDMPFEPFGIPPPLSDRVPGGFNVLFGDGSVRFFKQRDTQEQTLKAIITRNGNEVVSLP
jgi:prepilin-type processing-associated H-X9-DG protein